jgi:hypothetical protein
MAYKEDKTEEKNDKSIASEIVECFNKAYKAKQSKETLFREIYRRYRSYLEVTQQTTRSSLFIPESFTLVETVAPRMTARKPSFKAIPRSSSAISKADAVGKLLDYRYDVMGLQETIKEYVKQGLIYGTSIIKMGWDAEYARPCAYAIDLADIFPDPDTCRWNEGYIIHRYYKEVDDLKKSKIKYTNLDQLELKSKTGARDDQMRQDRQAIQGVPFEQNKEGCEILEWWGYEDGEIYVKAVANRSVLIRNEKNPNPLDELPFVPFFDQFVPFDKWGIGEIEPIMDLQDEENTTRNQRIDEKNLSIHNMWIVSKTSGIDYKTLISKPGGIILANDINGIKGLEKQNITQNSIEEINLTKKDIQNATGVNDYVKGAGDANSATESAINTQEANQRFADKVNNLEIALKKIGRWIVALDAEFLTSALKIQIMGKYGIEEEVIKLSDIKDEFDVDIESGSSLPANPDLRRQQLRELLQVIYPILTNPAGIPDGLREYLRTLIQSYDLKNADEILQGAQHPLVNQAMANLNEGELQGVNPQLVEQEIRKQLMGSGALNQQQPQQGIKQPPMREQMPNATTIQ